MNPIETLLAQKETARQELKRQIEALRRSAALLAEPVQRTAQPEIPAIVAAVAEAAERAEAQAGDSAVRTEVLAVPPPATAIQAGVPNFVRFTTTATVFPPANEGVIVCDGCGHRNPDYLLDCERCDLPIRLRA